MKKSQVRLLAPFCTVLAGSVMCARGATLEGARVENMACDNFYFNVVAGPKTVRIDSFAVYAYHQEKTRYYVYFHPGEFSGTENDASAWTLVSSTAVQPAGHDVAFTLSAGGTFVAAGQTGAFLICADLANDNGALWGGADGELGNGDVTVTAGKWLTRLNESKPNHFVTAGTCSETHGFGGIVTYEVAASTQAPRLTNAPPASVTLTEGEPLELVVGVDGTGPFAFQWFLKGAPVEGATNAVYRKRAALVDAGDYSVTVSGAVPPPATSGKTAVAVQRDTRPPTLVGASSEGALTNVVVRFSEPMDPIEAVNVARYALSGGVRIDVATLEEDGLAVRLQVARLRSFAAYALTAGGIADRAVARNALGAASQVAFTTPSYSVNAPTTGSILGNWGNAYFNLTAGGQDLTLLSLAPVAFHDADTDYLLFTHAGEFAGTEFQAAAWSMIASNHVAASPIPIPRPMGGFEVRIPAGKTQAFLVTRSTGGGTLYPGAGEIVAEDFTLSVGKNYTRQGEGLFDEGDEGGDPGFAGIIGYCLDSCKAPPAERPSLSFVRAGDRIRLSWTAAGFVLQSAASLGSPAWADAGGASPIDEPVGSAARFYRLIQK
jgi:hypothetical protein